MEEKHTRKIFLSFLFFFLFFGVLFSNVKAAILYLKPRSAIYSPGSVFIVNVKLDTEKECLNVVKADISFNKNILKLVDFSTGDSFLTYWVEIPNRKDIVKINKTGVISFAGGIPGGYCGRIPGDPGKSNIIATLIFSIPKTINLKESTKITYIKFLDTSRGYLNTATGKEAKLKFQDSEIKITKQAGKAKNAWQEILKNDKTPPEAFAVYIQKQNNLNNGKYFIVFNTTDKQSGMDHYEIKEYDKNGFIPGTKQKAEWQIAKSPHILKDQKLRSTILIKAVDKAWNERIVKFVPSEHITLPEEEGFFFAKLSLSLKIGLAVLIILILIIIFIKIKRKK